MKKILVLDDNEAHRRFVSRCLASEGKAKVMESSCIAEAERVMSSHSIECAVIDLNLSADRDREGLEFVNSISHRYPATRIVVLTGDFQTGLTELCYERGACAVLHKPASVEMIRNLV